jgi:hypothetical protein
LVRLPVSSMVEILQFRLLAPISVSFNETLHLFPGVAVTKHRRLGDLEKQKFTVTQF